MDDTESMAAMLLAGQGVDLAVLARIATAALPPAAQQIPDLTPTTAPAVKHSN